MTISIKGLAREAWAEKQQKDAKQEEQKQQYHCYLVRCGLAKLLSLEDKNVEKNPDLAGTPHGRNLELDGVLFAHPQDHSSPSDLRVVFGCKKCLTTFLSPRIIDLAHLGALLQTPELEPKAPACSSHQRHVLCLAAEMPGVKKTSRTRVVDI